MENRILKNDAQSFLHLAKQRDKAERMNRFFAQRVGTEEVSRREENVKYFDMGMNRRQAVVYSEPVHFRNSDGEAWQEIDNTLEEAVTAQGRQVLRNRANRMRVEFPVQMDGGDMASVTENGRTFAWRLEQAAQPAAAKARTGAELKQERLVKLAQRMPKFVGRTAESLRAADLSAEIETEQERRGDIAQLKAENVYENVLPGLSVRYTVTSDRLKEDLILANAAALESAALRLPKGFDYEVAPDQSLRILDQQTGETAFQMDAPYVYDANGNDTIASVVLSDCGEYIRLAYALDDAFLAKAVFPVTIDPVIHSGGALTNIQDTTLGEGQSFTPYTEDHMKVGKFAGSIRCVGLLKFNALAIPRASDAVISAVLQMAPKSSNSSKYIGAYEVLKPWESATVNWLNFNPDDTSNVAADALECVKGSSNTWLNFDLTNLYRKWCTRNESGVSNNNGVAFRTPANISGDNYSELYSSDASSAYRPVMYVNYVSHAGIEGWWQYEQMSAGRAGTVYADLFNGNMVLEHADTSMTGNRNPVSVNHYYNSCRCGDNSYGSGYGWKTDAHQKITALTLNDTNYYVWEDGDGTEHFFEYTGGSGPFKDAEGMELELRIDASAMQITITDKSDNVMTFKILQAGLAWLESAKDACGNTSTYAYVSGHEAEGRLDKITDPVGRVTQFSYNSDGLIASIAIPAAENNALRTVYYTYDSAKRLTGVRYSELGGTVAHTTYAYDGATNLLTRARNFDGVQVNVGYESTSLYGTSATDDARRVKSLETVATSGTGAVTMYGAKQIFEYGAMTTEVTAVEDSSSDAGKKLYYQFNDAGNVTCVRDDLGFAQFTKYDSGIENKPSQVSKLRKAVVNRLRKPDFNSQWTAVTAGGTAAKDADTSCLNCASMKLNKTGAGEVIYRQEVPLEAGTAFTLSAYVKTDSLTGGGAFLRIRPVTAGAFEAVSSDGLTGTTDAAVGNELPTDGWERIRVTLEALTAPAQAYVELVCDAAGGTAWFACPQLETGEVMNAFNLVSNGDFRYTEVSGAQTLPLDWSQGAFNLNTADTGVFAASTDATFPSALEGNYVQVEGRPDKTLMGFVQNFDMKGKAGDIFVVGGWADGKSIPNADSRDKGFTLALSLKKASDGEWINPAVYPFNGEWVGWQQSCYATAAGADYTEIALYILYTGNCNKAKFTNIVLHREAYGTTFGYDDDGNVLSISNLAGQHSKSTYDSEDNEQTYVQPGREDAAENQYWAYYGDSAAERKKHLPWRTRTPMNVTQYFSYDSYGNRTSSRQVDYRVFTGGAAENTYPYMRTETAYDANGNYTATTKDARGNVVTQSVNANDGTLTSVTDPTGQTVNYTYDASRRVTAVQTTGDGKTYKNAYTYENDRIKTVSHNTTSDTANDVTYTFGYDGLGRKTTVKVGTQTLSTNVYESDRSGLLSEVQYGNGGKVKYTYDDFDRMTGVKYDAEATPRYEYKYGANGEVAEVIDHELNRTARTDYDQANRPCQTELRDSATGTALYKTCLKYDKLNNLEMFSEQADGENHKTEFVYDRDNRVTELKYDGGAHKVNYTYDELGRVVSRVAECGADAGKLTSTYTYVDGGYGTNSTTPLVKKIAQNGISFEYEYDSRGNITSEKRGDLTTTYQYDALGQLIRVNDPHENATWVYNYDRGGNILSKVKYAYTTGAVGTAIETIPYVYGDSNWKDKLTSYNGQTITYDAIGNPLNDETWTYTWQAGRQLKQMSAEGTNVSFKYDHNGMRVQKVVEQSWYPETTNYTYHGKLLTHMTVDYTDFDEVAHQDEMHFFYDSESHPAKISYNGIIYTYVHNIQGNIVGIVDNNGTIVVEYKYDVWGKPLGVTGSLASTLGQKNPFRYRAYIYDEETELYYLQNRYYDPGTCRFLNADHVSNLGTNNELLTYNGYAYCENDPVNCFDSEGCWALPNWAKAAIGVVTTVAAVAVTVATGGAALPVIAGVAASTVSGAIGGYITGGKEGAIDGAADGLMFGGIGALASSAIGAIKTVRAYKKTVDTYSTLTKRYKGSGMEAHHIIEKRLAEGSRWKISQMPSVELTKTVHRTYTNLWRREIAYGTKYADGIIYKYRLYKAANLVYKQSRVLRMAARYTIFKM